MPPLELILAIVFALILSYLVTEVLARVARRGLLALFPEKHEPGIVDRPVRVIRLVLFVTLAAALVVPAMKLAGVETTVGWTPEALVEWLLGSGVRIAIIVTAAWLVARIGAAAADRFEREIANRVAPDKAEQVKRARTLGRIVQKTLTFVTTVIAMLMVLRVLGMDITPVLTGAGIAGLAVGFGAQTLVRDVISGFFMLLEDQVRVGDSAVVNGHAGLVEAMNLRTIVLRDEEGTVLVVPNGEVRTLANRSKEYAYYVVTVAIPYAKEPDVAVEGMRAAAESLRADPKFAHHILAPLEVFGVDDFRPADVTIKARIKTLPQRQSLVGRELRRRIMQELKARGIWAKA